MDVTNNSNMTDELINENLNHLFKFKTDLISKITFIFNSIYVILR